jgi:APA family basic amino acid/polyamine antiporter
MAEQKKNEVMQRKVGLFQAVTMITGLVVGAGIFIMVPKIVDMTGASAFLAYALAAIPSLFVVLYQIQLTGTLPVTGANYVAATRVISPLWGAIISISVALALIASNVLLAVGFGQYVVAFIQSFNPAFNLHPLLLPLLVILFFSLLNFLGVEFASAAQVVMFLAFVIGMVIFGVVGSANYNPVNMTPMFKGGAMMFIVAMVLACFSWAGLVALADIGGEIKNPRRNLPLSLIIAFLIIFVLYVLQPFALVASMGVGEVAKAGSPAIMLAAGKLMPGWGIWVVFIAAMGALLTSINALTWSAGRDLLAWARDGLLPKAIAHLHPKFKTPDLAILIVTVMEIIGILVAATIDKYALATILALMVIQITGAYCVLRIPKKLPALYDKSLFKFNGFWRWLTFIGVCITSGFVLLMGIFLDTMDAMGNPTQIPWVVVIFVLVLAIGIIWYYIRRSYLKSKGVDLEDNLKKVADATLAEAEEKLSI